MLLATENLNGLTWGKQVQRDLADAQLTAESSTDRNSYRSRIENWEVLAAISVRKTGTIWTDEMRAMSEKMNVSWANSRKNCRGSIMCIIIIVCQKLFQVIVCKKSIPHYNPIIKLSNFIN